MNVFAGRMDWLFTIRYTISIVLKLCCEKRHEQVEKTLEMKKWSRNGSSNETR